MGASLGFSSTDLTLLATAISEVARNITTYAGEGEVQLRLVSDGGRQGIEVIADRRGPGDRRRRAGDAGRLHDRQRARARAARHAPARRRLRARDGAGRRDDDPAGEVEPCLIARAPTGRPRSSSASRSARSRASAGRATVPCSSLRGRRARRRDRRARARRGRRRRRGGRGRGAGRPPGRRSRAPDRRLPPRAEPDARRGHDAGLVRPRGGRLAWTGVGNVEGRLVHAAPGLTPRRRARSRRAASSATTCRRSGSRARSSSPAT